MKLPTIKILPNSHGIRQREETGKRRIQYNALMQTPNFLNKLISSKFKLYCYSF